MKKIVLIFLFLISSYNLKAQYLNLKTLLDVYNSDVSELNDLLSSKKWSFIKTEKLSYSKEFTFAFGHNEDITVTGNDESTAIAWIFIRIYSSQTRTLRYQFHNLDYYNKLIAELKSFNPIKTNTFISDNKITTEYEGKNYTYSVEVQKGLYQIEIDKKDK